METYACYLIALDSFGDKIIEMFVKEDNHYLNNLAKDEYSDTVFKYYKSDENVVILDKNYFKTSCVFFIGSAYNNRCKDFINEYDLNIIKILKNKGALDGKSVYYSDNCEEIFSFLRVFTLPLSFTGFLPSDWLIDVPSKDEIEFFKFNEFNLSSIRLKFNEVSEDWKNVIDFFSVNLNTTSTKWFLRIITSETKPIPIHIMNELAITIAHKLGDDCFGYTASIWNTPYQEIELIYE